MRYPGLLERRSLYDEDIYAWSQQQADALRRLAQTRRDLPNDLDLEHVAEEIEDVGKAEFNRAKSFIRQMFVHLVELASAPESEAVRHWRGEILGFHTELSQRLTRSMHARINLDTLWTRAVQEAEARLGEGKTSASLFAKLRGPPFTIEELAADTFDIDQALAKLANALEEVP